MSISRLVWNGRDTSDQAPLAQALRHLVTRDAGGLPNGGSHQLAARRSSTRTVFFRGLWRDYGSRRAIIVPSAFGRASGQRPPHAAATPNTGPPGVSGALTLR